MVTMDLLERLGTPSSGAMDANAVVVQGKDIRRPMLQQTGVARTAKESIWRYVTTTHSDK